MSGTTPEGTHSEEEAARWVRGMFGRVAHRYDFANHLLSGNLDRLWRARTVRLRSMTTPVVIVSGPLMAAPDVEELRRRSEGRGPSPGPRRTSVGYRMGSRPGRRGGRRRAGRSRTEIA